MKFSELYESNEEVLIKRAKHVHKLLHKGVIDYPMERGGKITIKYQLPPHIKFTTIQLVDSKYYACIEILDKKDNNIIFIDTENDAIVDYDDDNELFYLLFKKFAKFNVVLLDLAFFVPFPGYDFKIDVSREMGIKLGEYDF